MANRDRAPEHVWLAEDGTPAKTLSDPNVSPLIDSVRNTPIRKNRLRFPEEVMGFVKEHLHGYIAEYLTCCSSADECGQAILFCEAGDHFRRAVLL